MQPTSPLFGSSGDRQRLAEAIRKRDSLLIRGPAGAGKTALIQAAIADLPDRHDIVQISYSSNLHQLLVDVTQFLLLMNHKALLDLARPVGDQGKWVISQTSLHLKGILWTCLQDEPITLILDDVDGGSFPMYRFLQKLFFTRGMTLIGAARDTAPLGALSRLFFDPRSIIHVRPLRHLAKLTWTTMPSHEDE